MRRPDEARRGLSRRALLGAAGASTAAVALGASRLGAPDASAATVGDVVPFHGAHQAGITTPAQDRLHLAAFDVTARGRDELVALLREWSAAAARMTAGLPVGGPADGVGEPPAAPPSDTGEALGLPASRLTVTVGFGSSLFDDRFGLAGRRPAALQDLPPFAGDALDPSRGGGDLVVQACADDPQVAVHAVRGMARLAAGRAAVRWSQLGFGRTSTTSTAQSTPRNLFGFKDGTANVVAEDRAATEEHVWVPTGAGSEAWMAGGSYLVYRRVAMIVETWDRTSLAEQEAVVGRHKATGAPLGRTHEHDPLDVAALPMTSHVRLAHPDTHGGARMLRRGYSYVDGSDGLGHLDAGLLFLAFVRDPERQFVPVQQALSRGDALGEYLRHTASGVWAVPPGCAPGGFLGEALLA